MGDRNIYIIEFNGLFKIGVAKDPEKRLKQLSLGENAKIIHSKSVAIPFMIENMLHDIFKDKRESGEWFKLNNDDIGYIKEFDEGSYSELL